MLKRYVTELAKHVTRVFTLAGVFIALVWFIPPSLDWLGWGTSFPRTWLDQALLTAVAAVVALLVGSYLTWRERTWQLDEHLRAARDTMPSVTMKGGQFAGDHNSPVNSYHRIVIYIDKAQNRGANPLYMEKPIVYKWGLPSPVGGPGEVTLFNRDEKNRQSRVLRAPLKAQELTFGLEVEIKVKLEVKSLEELASALKRLRRGGSVTLRFTFSPEVGDPIDEETPVDFESFCSQVLMWWEQEKRTDLLRLYGDS